jgi:hypothetical protein
MRRNAITLLFTLVFLPATALTAAGDQPEGQQSYESCGLITGEYLTVLQLISRGYTPESLKQALPDISEKAQGRVDMLVTMSRRDGIIDSYSTINAEYAVCAKKVFDARGLPPKATREAHFHQCAGENKVGYEIAIAALIGAPEADVVKQLDSRHKAKAESIFQDLESAGTLAMFDSLSTELKRCLAALP